MKRWQIMIAVQFEAETGELARAYGEHIADGALARTPKHTQPVAHTVFMQVAPTQPCVVVPSEGTRWVEEDI
jgi:hypothetical protein